MTLERLQKVIAQAGVASRRGAEDLIRAGRVRVNGRIVEEMGVKVDARKDRVEVDGKRIVAEKPAYYVAHKPRKMVSTMDDPEGRDTVASLCRQISEAVHPVGRLDYHTSGVLLLTNDGALTEALLRPASRVPKVYIAKVQGQVDQDALAKLRGGVELDDGYRTKPAEVIVDRTEGKATWLKFTLHEGKNRQIHRMGDAIGHRVMRLARLQFAGISAEGLRPGQVRALKKKEIERLEKRFLKPHRERTKRR
ncbi:MAG: pseudouridine synthase [Myxococcota bacterium]